MTRGGFTLVEILVAMVILEVGLLGVVGTLWLAARTLNRAESLEQGVEVLESVYDSLAAATALSDGARSGAPGVVRWRVSGSLADLVLVGPAGDTVAALAVRLRRRAPP